MFNYYYLTKKEKEICKIIIENKIFTWKAIAEYMNARQTTINTHLYNIYMKFDIHSMAELVDFLYCQKLNKIEKLCNSFNFEKDDVKDLIDNILEEVCK